MPDATGAHSATLAREVLRQMVSRAQFASTGEDFLNGALHHPVRACAPLRGRRKMPGRPIRCQATGARLPSRWLRRVGRGAW